MPDDKRFHVFSASKIPHRDLFASRWLYVQVGHCNPLAVVLNEELPGLDLIPHQHTEDVRRLGTVQDTEALQHAAAWVHGCLP